MNQSSMNGLFVYYLVTFNFSLSTNKEAAGRDIDNELIVRVPVEIKAQLSLIGRSTPEQLDYSIRIRTPGEDSIFDSDIGPVVSHLYQVITYFSSL